METRIFNSDHDDLWEYAQKVMDMPLNLLKTPIYGLQMFGSAACVVLDREGQFQAELCIFPPDIDIPLHEHPDVDSIEIQITGSLRLFIKGKDQLRGGELSHTATLLQKVGIRIPIGHDHNVEIGAQGAVFLSVQKWARGTPDHVGHNWHGVHYSDDQRERLLTVS